MPSTYVAGTQRTSSTNAVFLGVLAAVVLFLATVVLNISPSHSWSFGDFAMYLLHAINIAEGRPYGDVPFMWHPDGTSLGPTIYPPGYPLLLAIIYKIFGLNLFVIKIFNALLLGVSGVLAFLIARRSVDQNYAAYAVALFLFCPMVLRFSDVAYSEFAFIFWSMLTLFLISKRDDAKATRHIIALSILIGTTAYLSYATRTIGIALILAIVIYDVIQHKRPYWARLAPAIVVFLLGYYAQKTALMSQTPNYTYAVEGYADVVRGIGLANGIENIFNYVKGFAVLYALPEFGDYGLAKKAFRFSLGLFMTLLMAIALTSISYHAIKRFDISRGIANSIFSFGRNFTVSEIYICVYLGMLLFLPFAHGRMLMPVLPIMTFIIVLGLSKVHAQETRYRNLVFPALFGLTFISFLFAVAGFRLYQPERIDDPRSAEMIEFVRKSIPQSSIISMRKARVLALYTGKRTVSTPAGADVSEISAFFEDTGTTHLVLHDESLAIDNRYTVRGTDALRALATERPDLFGEPIFENELFRIFQLRRLPDAKTSSS